MNAETIGHWSGVGFVLCGFCVVLFRTLLASGYPPLVALGLGVFSLVQPAYLEASGLRTILFSVTSFAVVWAAAALVQRQEPRRIVLLASSLAGAQFLNPLCGVATMLILPLALRRAFAKDGMKHGTGLYISLLFIPALALAYRSIAQPEFSALMALRQKLSAPLSPMALVPLAAAVPVGFTASRLRNADLPPVVAMIAAIAGVGVFGTLFGFQRSSLTTAVLAALSVFVVSRWPADSSRTRNAVLLIAANLVLSWMLEVHSGGYHA